MRDVRFKRRMEEKHEKVVSMLEQCTGPFGNSVVQLLKIIAIPFIFGVMLRHSDFVRGPMNILVFGAILLAVLAIAAVFTCQRISFTGSGLKITGLLRKSALLDWNDIREINYGPKFRWLRIKGPKGIAYFNSTDGLVDFFDLVVVTAYRTGFRCPDRVKTQVIEWLDAMDLAELEKIAKPKANQAAHAEC